MWRQNGRLAVTRTTTTAPPSTARTSTTYARFDDFEVGSTAASVQ